MTSRIILSIFALTLTAQQLQGQRLQVQTDRQNVVASRLAGAWQPDSALTARLGGRFGFEIANTPPGVTRRIEFRSDPSIAERVPQQMDDMMRTRLPNLQVFMAG